jgi:hypothetical protein
MELIDRNPSLMHLRLLQVLSQQPGNTIVLGMQPGGAAMPIRGNAPGTPDLPRTESGDHTQD